ncbi:MAG TPA: penicillin-binding protein 2 [Chloroflexota bacterium]|nr:penicillin-binding protein 2 [Chloroflexota bacterium]
MARLGEPETTSAPRGRTRLLRLLVLAAFLVLSLQAWRLQVVQGRAYREQADYNRVRISAIPPTRGVIYDASHRVVAANVPSFVVSVVPADLPREREERVFRRLAGILGVGEDTIRAAVERGRGDDAFAPVVVRRGVDSLAIQRVEEQHTRLPGVLVQSEAVREYPEGDLLSHILGYVGAITAEEYDLQRRQCSTLDPEQRRKECYGPSDRVGIMGLERQYERELRGSPGQRLSEVDVSGRTVRELREEHPEPGLNLVMNVDAEFQRAVERLVREGLRESPSAVAIVTRPSTGEILALVSVPSFDNNVFLNPDREAEIEALLTDGNRPLFHRAVAGQYPPGSTFKLVTAAAALHENIANRNTVIESRGAIFVPDDYNPRLLHRFPDWAVLGRLNFTQAIALSSDVYFYYLGGGFERFEGLGNERLAAYARQFGFGARTGIDLPGEAEGIVPDEQWKQDTLAERWVKGDTYNMSIGQGFVAVTPLQIANMTNAIANGGTIYRPRLVHALVDQEGRTVREFAPEIVRKLPLAPEQWALIREGMEQGYNGTLLQHLRTPGLRAAGKTGTAEFYGPRNARGELPTHAWYTGFAPADKPEIAVTVFVELGSGSNEAAPIATRIFRNYFNLPDTAIGPMAPTGLLPPPPPGAPAPAAPNSTAPAAPARPAPAAPAAPVPAPAPPAAATPAPTPPPAAPQPTPLPRPAIPTLGTRANGGAPAAPPSAGGQAPPSGP